MIKIITDTTAVLPKDFTDEHDIPVIPQFIHIDDETYKEGIDIDNSTFLKKLTTAKTLPKTSAPPPDLFIKEFKKYQGQEITFLCIHPSQKVSGTVRSAQVAAQSFPDMDIRIIDTNLIASPLGTLVTIATSMAESGIDPTTIESAITSLSSRCKIYFLVATLEYLAKGGRIGGASAILGSVLQVKPILTMIDGQVETKEKERTMRRAFKRIIDLVIKDYPKQDNGYLSIMHADAYKAAQDMAEVLANSLGIDTIPIYDLPPAITTHAGPGTLAAGFFTEDQ